MKSSRTLFLILAVVLLPGGIVLLLPILAKPIGGIFSRLAAFRLSPSASGGDLGGGK
jgi:hypothetical protein